MTIISNLFRTLGELHSLLASPTDGNVEAARKIVDDMCVEAGILERQPSSPGSGPEDSE